MAVVKHNKIKLREVNRHLVCRLCRGYYIDATTIAECLHSFCRSCIIKYLEKNSFCPVCEVQIHKTKPYLNLRLDKALQDVVYKLVPGLYHDEMKRRREFYAKHQEQIPITTPEQCGLEERIIFSPDDSISLSLEYLESDEFESETVSSQSSESGDNTEGLSFPQQLGLMKLKNGEGKTSRRESQDVQESSSFPKRYLQCPAVVSVFHLKKFIRMKHELTDKMQVDIVHKRVPLPDHFTLMDVAYIYTWKRSSPMRFFYEISETKKHKVRVSPPFAKADESKVRFVNGESKSSKEEINLNHKNDSSCEKTAAEVVKNISDVKSEITSVDQTVSDKFKQTINDSLKCGDNNNKRQGFVEHKKESCEKLEGNTNVFETELKGKADEKTVESSQKDNLSDKSESGGIKAIDVKNKSEKTKVVKDVNANAKANSNVQDFKEKSLENNDQRLLLNPISGQLESVPSINQSKPNVKDKVSLQVEKQESVETVKKFVPDQKSKKSLPEGIKEVKKSSVNLLKSFRKEKLSVSKEQKAEGKHVSDNALTITTVPKPEKSAEKDKANVSIEIKSEKKESEYDFDGTSPPSKIMPLQEYSKISKQQKHSSSTDVKKPQNNWMSLQDFRMQMLKQNNPSSDDLGKKDKRKSVPSLFRIGMESNKKSCPKTPNGKLPGDKAKTKKMSPTIINIKTEDEDRRKTEIKIELPTESGTPPKPIKIENKGGEYSIKPREEEPKKVVPAEKKSPLEVKKPEESKNKVDCNKSKDLTKVSTKRSSQEKPESENSKKSKPNVEETKNDNFGAIDLSKTDTSPRSGKNPLENLMDLASKSGNPKSDENMVEALISAAQKQSIEPLLKIPQYSQNVKNSSCQGSPPVAKNISSNDISQALQFFKDLRSDIKVLEAKSQLSPNSFLEQFSQKSANLEPIQLYQQHIDLIRRLKRQQMATAESETPQRKQPRFSPTSECTRKSSPDSKPKMTDEAAQLKSSLERTISQIQEQMELQSRIVAAQNYKNLPALLQFYNRPPAFCPGPPSPSKSSQNKLKSSHSPNSQKSPNSRKSPQSLTSPSSSLPLAMSNSEASFFNAQKYNHLINAGLNSEMTFHQMFQNYLNQQDKMNQIKHSQAMVKKPQGLPSAKTISDLYYGSQTVAKKPEPSSVSAVQKT